MSVYGFAGTHPIAEEIAALALSAHANTPIRVHAGDRFGVELLYGESTAAQVTVYAKVTDDLAESRADELRGRMQEASEGLESAIEEAQRLNAPTTVGVDNVQVTVRVEMALVLEDLGNLRDTLRALEETIVELTR